MKKNYKNLFIILGLAMFVGLAVNNVNLASIVGKTIDVALSGVEALADPDSPNGTKPNGQCAVHIACWYYKTKSDTQMTRGTRYACFEHGDDNPNGGKVNCSNGNYSSCYTDDETACQ